jgi:hypothetical protein
LSSQARPSTTVEPITATFEHTAPLFGLTITTVVPTLRRKRLCGLESLSFCKPATQA